MTSKNTGLNEYVQNWDNLWLFFIMKRMDNKNILDVKNLRKVFDGKVAVDDISFSFSRGEFVGLLGPNGAGKTTTIKMLIGLIKPTNGEIDYYGRSFFSYPKDAKRFIGVVPQENNLDRDLTAFENLYLHAILHGMTKSLRKEKIDEALDFAGLIDHSDHQVKTFSGGMKRRLVIVRALLHDPEILFLDEPTIGLDPQIRRNLWDLIIKINQVKKTAILLTTHYIEEAEKLCGEVMIINKGNIIAEGSPDALMKDIGQYALEVYLEDRIEEQFFPTREEALSSLEECTYPCKIREVTLEDVFLTLTGRRINV